MAVNMRFLGVAAYEFITEDRKRILIDPYIDTSPRCPVKSTSFEKVDLILVTHAPFDHFGDTEEIAKRTGAPVICGGEIKNYLIAKGLRSHQIQATVWGIAVEVAGLKVYPVENHHWSQLKMPDGSFASGVPNSYIVYFEEHIRFYHYGDTAIFRDLSLIRDIHRPTHGCLGITNPPEILDMVNGPGKLLTAEMNPLEASLAAQWLGLNTVFPCHYYDPECKDVFDFMQRIKKLQEKNPKTAPRTVALSPGEWFTLEPVPDWEPLYR
jgi:L-ascorbate metabolism protein UlaG (beta-lactamase superfamily)